MQKTPQVLLGNLDRSIQDEGILLIMDARSFYLNIPQEEASVMS